jgi:hypothetical protein
MTVVPGEGMFERKTLKALIHEAFADVEYPGDWCLRDSNEGEEPLLVEREFTGKDDWKSLSPAFLDSAPDGFSSALSFFSDEAFRFYLPAYLVADIDGRLRRVVPAFYLCHGLEDTTQNERVNPRRYGERTWRDAVGYRFSTFSSKQAAAIVAYLKYKSRTDEFQSQMIEPALRNYWLDRARA